jgi:GR25 family glycosyltransferase involved in LPS biosynthesis
MDHRVVLPVVAIIILLAGIAIVAMRLNAKACNKEAYMEVAMLTKIPVVVINLQRNVERLHRISRQFKECDLSDGREIVRVSAIAGDLIDTSEYVNSHGKNQLEHLKRTGHRTRHHHLSTGAVGCYLSHISIMRSLIIDASNDMYIVFEDDADIPQKLARHITRTLRDIESTSLHSSWDMIIMGHHYVESSPVDKDNAHIHQVKWFWGSHAIILHKRGAEKVVDFYNKNGISMQIDSLLSVLAKRGDLNVAMDDRYFIDFIGDFTDIQHPVMHSSDVDPFEIEHDIHP